MLPVGIVLALVGISGIVVGIVLLMQASNVADDNAIARGSVGGGPITFTREADGRITLYLRSTSSNTEIVDSEVDDTTCTVEHGGRTSTIDGAFQSLSVTLGSTATIGYVDVEAGPVAVTCDGTRAIGAAIIVAKGGPPSVVPAFIFLFAGIGLFIGGLVLVIVGAVLRARSRRPPPPMRPAYG
jgi:hypothetical protein